MLARLWKEEPSFTIGQNENWCSTLEVNIKNPPVLNEDMLLRLTVLLTRAIDKQKLSHKHKKLPSQLLVRVVQETLQTA